MQNKNTQSPAAPAVNATTISAEEFMQLPSADRLTILETLIDQAQPPTVAPTSILTLPVSYYFKN